MVSNNRLEYFITHIIILGKKVNLLLDPCAKPFEPSTKNPTSDRQHVSFVQKNLKETAFIMWKSKDSFLPHAEENILPCDL